VDQLANKTVPSCDGFQYTPEAEERLNGCALRVFGTESGIELLRYLENITINNLTGPNADDKYLQHLEGQRWIVGIIKRRMFLGKKEK
jgi:hypothetical protein